MNGARLRRRDARGGAAVLTVTMVGLLVVSSVLVATLGGAVADQRRVEAAADLAALAGAGADRAGRDACDAARVVAQRNGGRLVDCSNRAGVVTVRVLRRTAALLGRRFLLTGRARAGPAEAATPSGAAG